MNELLFGDGIGHCIMLLAFVIAAGLYIGKFKFKGITLGSTWILFVGIIVSHFGFRINPSILMFLKEFGLILFVFSIGLQVGPGFFHSFKSGGLKLNMLAVGLILLACLTAYVIHLITGESLSVMTGVMSGAVTNTPGLGAAQQTILSLPDSGVYVPEGMADALASGYAVAYPIGTVGVILVLIAVRALFKIDTKKEAAELDGDGNAATTAMSYAFEIKNPALYGRQIRELDKQSTAKFVISRLRRNDKSIIPGADTVLQEGDQLLVITSRGSEDAVTTLFGKEITLDKKAWERLDTSMIVKTYTITKTDIVGKRLGELNIRSNYGVSITRVARAGVDLVANPNLVLQLGDALRIVGPENSVKKLRTVFGDSISGLNHPFLIPIFLGIMVGVIFGSIPFKFPGIPQAIKLGLAGGPLIVAILLGYFGPRFGINTYTTTSANLMIREIGISIFLASVGLGAGENFVGSIVGGGYWWILYGAIITLLPVFLTAVAARLFFHLNFYQIAGLLTGGTTNVVALSFAQDTYGTDYTSVNYATVYPLSMFVRVLVAQVLVLIAFT
ncbi:MAG: putative transporter [Bacteroidales bacterium]|nr:putative transporter [Bacteroidales bacterium]